MSTYNDFPSAYIRLRTLLDSLQANMIRYCLEDGDVEVRLDRMNGVEEELMNLIGKVGGDSPCAPGYYLCDGVCVPYVCIYASDEGAESAA